MLKQQLVNLLDLYKNAVELERVMAVFSRVAQMWASSDSDGRTGLARGLLQYLVLDLDKQQIVDFRLHPWADQYLMLRGDLYGDDEMQDGDDDGGKDGAGADLEGKENRFTAVSSGEAIVSPNGIQTHKILIATNSAMVA